MNNKILILCCYYNRPNMFKSCLESVKLQNYENWELCVVDDCSEVSAISIIEPIFGKDSRVFVYNTQDKNKQFGESVFGKYWNEHMYSSHNDLAIMLCDDDMLYPNYLKNLDNFYNINTKIKYSYSHIQAYNPFKHDENIPHNLNNSVCDICPVCVVDASQVSWKVRDVVDKNIKFPFPKTENLDEHFYKQLYSNFGNCVYNGFISQYKGIHDDQLGKRHNYITKDVL